MDKEILIANIRKFCAARNLKPTIACVGAGVGRSYVSDIARGQTPSVASVADLAAFLGVTTSDLVGDAATPAELRPLAEAWADLNEEGREKLTDYAADLVAGGRYKKHAQPALGEKEA